MGTLTPAQQEALQRLRRSLPERQPAMFDDDIPDYCPRCANAMTEPGDNGDEWHLAPGCAECLVCTDCCGHKENE